MPLSLKGTIGTAPASFADICFVATFFNECAKLDEKDVEDAVPNDVSHKEPSFLLLFREPALYEDFWSDELRNSWPVARSTCMGWS